MVPFTVVTMTRLWRSTVAALSCLIPLTIAQSCFRDTVCSGPTEQAFPGTWDSYIYAPDSRTVTPSSILSNDGSTRTSYKEPLTFQNNGSQIVLDFGKEVGGWISLKYTSTGAGQLGLAFTEAKDWIGTWSDDSNGSQVGRDGALYVNFTQATNSSVYYKMPDASLRGGFRYLTLFLVTNGTTTVKVSDVSLEIGFQPTWSNLKAYEGYFYSNVSKFQGKHLRWMVFSILRGGVVLLSARVLRLKRKLQGKLSTDLTLS